MNCCNNTQKDGNNQGNTHKGHMSHMLMMVLCCGAPILLLLVLPLISSVIPGSRGVLSRIIPFLCPLMMIFMIPMMFRKDKGNNNSENH